MGSVYFKIATLNFKMGYYVGDQFGRSLDCGDTTENITETSLVQIDKTDCNGPPPSGEIRQLDC